VRDVDATCDFYERALGMRRVTFGDWRIALKFGRQKINLHHYPSPHAVVADTPLPGTGDLCFISENPIAEIEAHLEACGVEIISGPIERSGAEGPILSLYCRDPDGNLIELSNRLG